MQNRLRHSSLGLGTALCAYLSTTGGIDPQYRYMDDGVTYIRKGVRDGYFVVDIALTALAFAGIEDTDWENIKSIDIWTPYFNAHAIIQYTSRSFNDLLETNSGLSLNAKILPSCGYLTPTDYIQLNVATFEGTDTSGYLEARIYCDGGGNTKIYFATASTTYTNKHIWFSIDAAGKPFFKLLSNNPVAVNNGMLGNNALSVGWHTVRWTSDGSHYALTVDGASAAFTAIAGADNGYWFQAVGFRENITFGGINSKELGAAFTHQTGSGFIDYVDYNNEHKWIFNGRGTRVMDMIGTRHLTWSGSDHLRYDVGASTILMDSGYSKWTKWGSADEYIPYKSGSPFDVSAILTGYVDSADYDGDADEYNFSPALIDFDYTDSENALLAPLDKNNSTYHIATGSMNYYDASYHYRWREDELQDPRIYSDTYKNVGYKGTMMIKGTVSSSIVSKMSGGIVLNIDFRGICEWRIAHYCGIDDLVVTIDDEPIYDKDNYLMWT